MKLAILSTVVAVALAQQDLKVDPDKGKTREEIGHKVVKGGVAPVTQDLKPRWTAYHKDVKRTKVRYGPYTLPSIKSTSLMSLISNEPGKMGTIGIMMRKPCTECGLVTASADLEYEDGSQANVGNKAWLHHVVFVATGPNRTDNACPLPLERFFSSGNERTTTAFGDVGNNQVKSIFQLRPSDSISAQLELMNMSEETKKVYMTVDWEYIPGKRPEGFGIAKAMWLDITGCGISSYSPPAGKTQFTIPSRDWTIKFNGKMLGVGGHLHDGGTVLNIYNNKKVICASKPDYQAGASHGHGRRSTSYSEINSRIAPRPALSRRDGPTGDSDMHIQTMSTCSNLGPVKKGDVISIDASYDFDKYKGMKGPNGKYTAIMGIAILYSAADPEPWE